MGRLSTNKRNGHFFRPSNLRWRSPQRSTIDPPVCRRYRLSHCLPNIATNAADSDISRLAYRRSDVVMISVGGPFHAGGAAGTSSGAMDRLRLRRIARRRASDRSLESGWSLDWTSMTKAELTAENRPAWEWGQRHTVIKGTQKRTKIKVVLRSSLCFCMYSVSYSTDSRLYMV